MKWYTGRGDGGRADLIDRQNVPKNAPVFELLGALDECGACLGVAALEIADADVLRDIAMLQELLVLLGGMAAGGQRQSLAGYLAGIEARIDCCQQACGDFEGFCNAYACRGAAYLNLARTVVRRAERAAVQADLFSEGVALLNRASDLLYGLTRYVQEGI